MARRDTGRRVGGTRDGPPVYTHDSVPGVPPVRVLRLLGASVAGGEHPPAYAHAHDFLLLLYFEDGGGSLRVADRRWSVRRGDAYVIAPGDVVEVGEQEPGIRHATGWAVFFPVEVLGPDTPGAFLSWRTHPLLFPFVRASDHPGIRRLVVPRRRRSLWSERFSDLDAELNRREDGYQEAVLAHLTLLLVELSRLAADVVGDLRVTDEPLLAEVFTFIEEHYGEPISLRDVARAVNLSPGHLTTVVRRKSGRTVGDWIVERRMTEARRLLVGTDLSVEEVGRRVGFRDPRYFVRSFRRAHETTPLQWRQAGRR